ncbi:MAG: NIPSNAP family protein [Betaproteobacteria bacterium]|nr:NIPSNAP family protein [Betaproteobacteria bacterium]
MIFDLRIYTMHHGKTAAWLKNYQELGLPLQRKYLGDPVMFSTTEVGPLNQVVHLWKFESMGDREKRREAIAADPAWGEYLKRSLELGAVMSQENRILKATSFSPLR